LICRKAVQNDPAIGFRFLSEFLENDRVAGGAQASGSGRCLLIHSGKASPERHNNQNLQAAA
jgi:hypothetical protein